MTESTTKVHMGWWPTLCGLKLSEYDGWSYTWTDGAEIPMVHKGPIEEGALVCRTCNQLNRKAAEEAAA